MAKYGQNGHLWPLLQFSHCNSHCNRKKYQHGKETSQSENKNCSETSEAMGTTWEHAKLDILKFIEIRITLWGRVFKNLLNLRRQLIFSSSCKLHARYKYTIFHLCHNFPSQIFASRHQIPLPIFWSNRRRGSDTSSAGLELPVPHCIIFRGV